jgi:hypothetical protein
VRVLRLVELERPADGLEDIVRHATRIAALEARVGLGADAGEQGDLLARQPLDAAGPSVGGQSGTLRREPRAAGGEELADLWSLCMAPSRYAPESNRGRYWQYPLGRAVMA